ncbi:MAG: transglycosylase domain-containing protein [Lachnospiraceae bacterium]|nr:transglycosylase domain-containing protein [Lachnospiraceae bacterium]
MSKLKKHSKKNATNTKNETKNKTKKKKKKIIRTVFLEIGALFLVTILLLGIVFYKRYAKDILAMKESAEKTVKYSDTEDFKQAETSLIFDTYGNQITSLKAEKDVYYLSDEEIPQYFKDAMVSVEDKKFYEHPGYDTKAIIRAMKSYIVKKGEITQGASTITQQLARNIYLTHEVTWERKIEEIFLAIELEKKYSKQQIMEFYLNNIYFANGYYGIEAASQGYFQLSAKDLSLSQAAFLCAIPNNPTTYNPMTNYENTMERRDFILQEMLKEEKISDLDYEIAIREEIVLNPKEDEGINNYVETYVFDCAAKALMEYNGFVFCYQFDSDEARKNYEERYEELYTRCLRSLYVEGYRIYTSIDMEKQELLQNALDEGLSANQELSEDGIYSLQGSATCIDNATGKVVAIVGGRTQEASGYTLNRAFQSYRQPGSSIKPLVVYTPAFERGYTPDTILVDEPMEDGPKNSGSYSGAIDIRTAVQYSKNTIAYKIFEAITPKVGMQYILNMGYSKIMTQDTYNMSSALGGFTYGVTTKEMASGFCTLQNDGVYRNPSCIVEILDAQGNVLVPNEWEEIRIYDRNASRMMTDVLVTVVTAGTGRGYGIAGMPCAGKTGTTNDKKDGWFVGYTPYYTTAVWVGYDIPKTVSTLNSTTSPGMIWKSYMEKIHEGLARKEFPSYTYVQSLVKNETEEEDTEEVSTEEEISSEVSSEEISSENLTETTTLENLTTEENSQEITTESIPTTEKVTEATTTETTTSSETTTEATTTGVINSTEGTVNPE